MTDILLIQLSPSPGSTGAAWRHVYMSGDICGCHNHDKCRWYLVSTAQELCSISSYPKDTQQRKWLSPRWSNAEQNQLLQSFQCLALALYSVAQYWKHGAMKNFKNKKKKNWSVYREMVQQLRAFVLEEDSGSVPSTDTVTHNHLF